jgi:hypothetical protein
MALPDDTQSQKGETSGAARSSVSALGRQSLPPLPLLLLFAAVSRYAAGRSGLPVDEAAASSALSALVIALCATLAVRYRNRTSTRSKGTWLPGRHALAVGAIGIGTPLLLLTLARNTLTQNVEALILAIPVLVLVLRTRRYVIPAVLCLVAAAILVLGRVLELELPPVRKALVSLVSGGVVAPAAIVGALVASLVAGLLTLELYRRAPRLPASELPGSVDILTALLLPGALLLVANQLVQGAFPTLNAWTLLNGASFACGTAVLVRIARVTSPVVAAIAALTTFTPGVIVSSRLMGVELTTPSRWGVLISVVGVVVLRSTLRRRAVGTETPEHGQVTQ